jgi:hypothetical protein
MHASHVATHIRIDRLPIYLTQLSESLPRALLVKIAGRKHDAPLRRGEVLLVGVERFVKWICGHCEIISRSIAEGLVDQWFTRPIPLHRGFRARVAPGDYTPRAPTDPYVPSRAYGSSRHGLATERYTEWIATGGGSGYLSSSR